MPIRIGDRAQSDFTDPIGLMTDCHRRIERFLGLLVSVTSHAHGGPLDDEQRAALNLALSYFRGAAPNHTLDEEESLFPRLRFANDPRARPSFALLQKLSSGHDVAEGMHLQIEVLAGRWLTKGGLSGRELHQLREMLEDLSEFYREHIALEEQQVFPLASRLLTRWELEAIGREMAERRGIDLRAIQRLSA